MTMNKKQDASSARGDSTVIFSDLQTFLFTRVMVYCGSTHGGMGSTSWSSGGVFDCWILLMLAGLRTLYLYNRLYSHAEISVFWMSNYPVFMRVIWCFWGDFFVIFRLKKKI